MKRIRACSLLVTLLALTFLSAAAHADSLTITLTETVKKGSAGNKVTFDASLTNNTGSTLYLNGTSSSTSSLFLSVFDTGFQLNAPDTLAAGASTGTFALFSVLIAPGTPLGSYGGNVFTILGGGNSTVLQPLGSATFTVNVVAAPEPASLLLLGSGLLLLAIKSRLGKTAAARSL